MARHARNRDRTMRVRRVLIRIPLLPSPEGCGEFDPRKRSPRPKPGLSFVGEMGYENRQSNCTDRTARYP
jgi:hypothetical protein